MSTTISSELNQGYRSALLAYYIGQYAPNSGDTTLSNMIKTPDDVYEYLLIDPLVTNDVQTSRVAQAMSSIQQYINSIALNMEPGYNTQSLDATQLKRWNNGADQYAVWGGYVELDSYPENYIDPTLRQDQTSCFNDLITELNQKTVSNDTAQQAVMGYLNQFEQVANLTIVSGYATDKDQTKGIYYLLGKSTSSPVQYYWRSFDMSLNVDNVLASNAWSEWYPINTSINDALIQGKPRLAYFNNRLYLFWFERAEGNGPNESDTITAYSSQCDFSRNWSSPYAMMSIDSDTANHQGDQTYCDELFTSGYLCTACAYNQTDNYLVVSLYDGTDVKAYTDNGYNDFTITIDYWFNTEKKEAKVSTGMTNILSKFLYNYIESQTITNNQRKIQSCFLVDKFYVADVKCDSTKFYDGLHSYITLPTLNTSNFSVNTADDGSITLVGTITTACNTTNTGNFYNESWSFNENDGALRCNFSYTDSIFTNMQLVDLPTTLTTTFNTVAIEVPYNTGMKTFPLSKSYSIENGVITDAAGFAAEMIVSKTQLTSPGGSNYFNFELRNNSTKILSIVKYSCVENFYKATSWTFDVFESKSSGCWQSTDATNCVSKTATSISSNTKFNYSVSDITDAEIATGAITRYISVGYINNCGGATTHTEYCVSLQKSTNIPATPLIATHRDEELGTVVFLSFNGAFDDGVTISPIRLNTLFAKELINKANVSIDDLLAWDTQLTLEPAMTSGASPTPMDFYGANGLYFWELFFYMPWLVASRLSQEGNYADAQKWFNYIFDPSACGRANSNADYPEPDYWSVRPLVEANAQESLAALILNPDDPDMIAKADPVHYQKAIAMAYLANLIAAGDADYRLLTNDGLAQAKLRYVQVKTLLGPRPDISTLQQWQPDTLENIASQRNTDLTALEDSASISLHAFAGSSTLAQDVTINDAFSLPLNAQLLNYWDVIDSRLYNLRHNLSITGQPINIPLYATPVNPALLVQMNATEGSLTGLACTLSMTIPPYRFAAMLQHARGAVGTLSQMGQTLLSYYERKESTGLQELQQQQALDLSAFTISLQKQAIDALKADQKALEASKDIAQQRYDYYYDLYTTGISASEQEVMNMQSSASALFTTAEPFLTAGAALNMVPNIFGLADGGAVWGAALTASGMVLQLSANSVQGTAQRIQVSEEYRRRSEEWKQQYQQADAEMASIDRQLDALAVRQQAAQTSLQQVQTEQANLQATMQYISSRFTQSSLYSWLIGQLAALYYQAYDAVLSLCLSAEACWQYEMGDLTSRFIQTNAWNDSYHGLLAGETLELNLQQMESAWLSRNQRRLELTKTVSLKTLLGDSGFANLITAGVVNFSLDEKLFDNDYPGHYLRQIKFVTLSLPTLLGPWQDVRATLTQTSSSTLLKADIDGVNYLNNTTTGNATNVVTNLRASQQIAVSSGMNDSGLFELSFGDERYLPFEGTGAVSSWQLSFPRPKSSEQKAILDNLSDVIVQVHYTAVSGGNDFASTVETTL
ncbi:hypothetical protein IRX42_004338 [Salmonella enterica]|nr:hypothetical protein [Salmonella enterica subsp. houtenae]EEU7648015.1 hypothetical protein [Salmonella enterica]EHD0026134.1 hypothetical protein [Salmonella enterica subsp. houtenae serovar 50:g,z51:-]ECI4026695.1 hypothetical protein [Salmonella enterica subsp. houtenae]ECJ2498179.1 hypothetical protein [Salmonella enterica subsp. houtenae]